MFTNKSVFSVNLSCCLGVMIRTATDAYTCLGHLHFISKVLLDVTSCRWCVSVIMLKVSFTDFVHNP